MIHKQPTIAATEATKAAVAKWANNLHHLTMIYLGGFAELARGKEIMFVAANEPGVKKTRDLLDLVLILRAEINGITRLLVQTGLVTEDQISREYAEQYEWLAKQKAGQFGVEVSDVGLVFKNDPSKN